MTVETHDMLLIHRYLQRELRLLPPLVRRAAGDPARAARLTGHASELLVTLHHHHTGEDELLWPVLRPRVTLQDDLIDRMEAQHHAVADAVRALERDLPVWARSADAETGERIASGLEQLTVQLDEHLSEEESQILPLVAAHFSQPEWDRIAEHGFTSIPPKRRLVTLAYILEESDDVERTTFLKKNVPAPARLAYQLIGRRQHAREIAAIRR